MLVINITLTVALAKWSHSPDATVPKYVYNQKAVLLLP